MKKLYLLGWLLLLAGCGGSTPAPGEPKPLPPNRFPPGAEPKR